MTGTSLDVALEAPQENNMKQATLVGLGVAAFFAMPAVAQDIHPVVHHHDYVNHHLGRGARRLSNGTTRLKSRRPSRLAFLRSFLISRLIRTARATRTGSAVTQTIATKAASANRNGRRLREIERGRDSTASAMVKPDLTFAARCAAGVVCLLGAMTPTKSSSVVRRGSTPPP